MTSSSRAALVRAASTARCGAQHWPDHPGAVHSGATAWRAICQPTGPTDIAVSWGWGAEFGIVPLAAVRLVPSGLSLPSMAGIANWTPPGG